MSSSCVAKHRFASVCYLGVILKYNNSFQLTIKINVDKAKKALFKLRAETSGHEIAIQTKLHLFGSIILPILRYGCEVRGCEHFEIFHQNFFANAFSNCFCLQRVPFNFFDNLQQTKVSKSPKGLRF